MAYINHGLKPSKKGQKKFSGAQLAVKKTSENGATGNCFGPSSFVTALETHNDKI